MLSDVPFTRTVDSQAGGIHNHVPRPAARTDGQGRRQGTLPSTDSAVVWNGKIESQQLQERRNEARRRPKAKLKHRLQHPCALDGRVGIDFRSAGGPLCGSALRQAAMAFSSNQRPGYPWRSAPDWSLASCILGTGRCIHSASFLMPAPLAIRGKLTRRHDLCNNAPPFSPPSSWRPHLSS